MKVVAIIPARYASTRFPGKPLVNILGKPMIQWVYERAKAAPEFSQVLVATDDDRIFKAVQQFGGQAVMTSADHQSGTERIVEASRGLEADVIINVQGDEPLTRPRMISQLVSAMREDSSIPVATLRYPLTTEEELHDIKIAKVIADNRNFAIYFSRSPIPCWRDAHDSPWINANPGIYWRHIGIYAYRQSFLDIYPSLSPTPLERLEQLEQLRFLEHGYKIKLVDSESLGLGVDVPEDVEKVANILANKYNYKY